MPRPSRRLLYATALYVAAGFSGCAARNSAPAPRTPLGTPHVGELAREREADLDTKPTPAPPTAQRLLAAANQLAVAHAVPSHTHVVHALVRLADALEVLVPERAEDILRVRQSATEMERSHRSALIHADLVRTGLEAAARALEHVRLPAHVDPMSIHALRLREATLAVTNAVAAIDTDAPLLDQYGYVRVAIRESTRAVYAALLAPEPQILVHTARR